jgi:hypothetical protein
MLSTFDDFSYHILQLFSSSWRRPLEVRSVSWSDFWNFQAALLVFPDQLTAQLDTGTSGLMAIDISLQLKAIVPGKFSRTSGNLLKLFQISFKELFESQ